jgi:hypothetical protein
MAEEDYEILPHQLLADLKYDVEALKKQLSNPNSKMQELVLEIESMKDSIHELNTVFQSALEDTKGEDPHKEIKLLKEKMETVLSQNETIARGMIAISDKLEEFMGKNLPSQKPSGPTIVPSRPISMPSGPSVSSPPSQMPIQHTMGPPSSGPRTAPPPSMHDVPPGLGEPSMDFPPPPPGAKNKRVGLFR